MEPLALHTLGAILDKVLEPISSRASGKKDVAVTAVRSPRKRRPRALDPALFSFSKHNMEKSALCSASKAAVQSVRASALLLARRLLFGSLSLCALV